MPNLIITGIPRSGTTLAAAIVDQSPDALCLSEPDHHVDLMNGAATAAEFVRQLCLDFGAIRRTILAGGSVLDRRCPDGTPVTNYFTSHMLDGRRKPAFVIRGITRIHIGRWHPGRGLAIFLLLLSLAAAATLFFAFALPPVLKDVQALITELPTRGPQLSRSFRTMPSGKKLS